MPKATAASQMSGVRIEVELDRRINWALQQNDVPVVKVLRVANEGEAPLEELELSIRSEPAFAREWSLRIDRIEPRATFNVRDIDLDLSPRFLAELRERVAGELRITLSRRDELLAEHTEPVECLASDEWSGLGSLPEILAAFVLPNHPAVERILGEAARVLGEWTGDPSLSGYQSGDPARVVRTAAAVHYALCRQDVTYSAPPASFELDGQKVRFPDRILETRLATCFDLALFAAACLEQAGLHPLVLLVRGHAFAGVWLRDECFPEPATDDALRIRKRVQLDEIVVFDPTGITARPAHDFERAMSEGRRRLERPEEFLCAVDVRRARKGSIRPLPERVPESGAPSDSISVPGAAAAVPSASVHDVRAPGPGEDTAAAAAPAETPETRLDRWKRMLLDLSLRNRLLNFRSTKQSIPLVCPDLALLEDALADGAAFEVHPLPRDFAASDPRSADLHRTRTGEDAQKALLQDELAARRLCADLQKEELDERLLAIYRNARTELEEGGASALYLAVGFLAWFESDASQVERRAPILLLPLELSRKSIKSGFTLRLADEEPRVNATLVEMLRQDRGLDVSGLDPLPEDESGVDVPAVLRAFRAAVRDIGRWDVVETAAIGFFSFAKFLMWRDLAQRADSLLGNPVVAHLVERTGAAFEPDAAFPEPSELDRERAPSQCFSPLPADSSQLAAVFAAAEGRTFVLVGPPGTGKSQTIANLVSHCLAEGKTVLFVSEKMAALEVVHARLEKIGLGPFCLELHSKEAQKSKVVAELGRALEAGAGAPDDRASKSAGSSRARAPSSGSTSRGRDASPAGGSSTKGAPGGAWERESRRLHALRNGLNAYVDALHQRRSTGESVFAGTSKLIGLRDSPSVALGWSEPESFDADRLAALRDVVASLATAADGTGGVHDHPWAASRRSERSPAFERDVAAALARAATSLDALQAAAVEAAPHLTLAAEQPSFDELALLCELCAALVGAPSPPVELVARPDADALLAALASWIARGRKRDELRSALFARYAPALLELELDPLRAALDAASRTWWLPAWWKRRSVRRALAAVRVSGRDPSREELEHEVASALELRAEQRALAAANDEARRVLGRYWKEGEADWNELEAIAKWARAVRSIASRAAGTDLDRAALLRERWARLAHEGAELLAAEGSLGRVLARVRATFATWRDAQAALEALAELDPLRAWGATSAREALERTRARLTEWTDAIPRLRDWCPWRRARATALEHGLAPLIEALERGELESGSLARAFEKSFYGWWTESLVASEPTLAAFSRPEHERRIQQFRELDEEHARLTRELVVARLAARVPRATETLLASSEMGVLRVELQKKRRHKSIRTLFQKIPHLLPRLKPCLLMSPMSVAQYLDPDSPPFDLVVFDEASQIPVWDAIGAIARGKQAVIVGDPKQLPPTSFFQRATDEGEEDVEDTLVFEDLESILDDCLASGIRALPLAWHYRSRHESLITFSNYHYYENRLHTFPSPMREGMGVSWRHVPDGVYDRSLSRTNRREAEEVVAEIARRLRDPLLSADSIGVVTFSAPQQTLVLDLLEALRRADPEIDRRCGEDAVDPVFVKNLENVQGDERDVILFSIGYGPDAAGKVSMNFGPMNRDGGERRLNVAVTRARKEVVVFSTLRAEQIDLTRTRAAGARDLKAYLEFAQRGFAAIAEATSVAPGADCESPFERDVCRALVERGFDVHAQVGCSGYRVDLAVVDPDAPGRYLLGIECDGANYHSAKTARDRDKLREGVLRGLGWQLHRIWSTDWWTDPAKELERVEAALARARSRRASTASAAPFESAPTPPLESAATAGSSEGRDERPTSTGEDASQASIDRNRSATGAPAPAERSPHQAYGIAAASENSSATRDRPSASAAPSADAGAGAASFSYPVPSPASASVDRAKGSGASPASPASHGGASTYSAKRVVSLGSQEDFYEASAEPKIRRVLAQIVAHEGPIHVDLAVRRAAAHFGFERVRAKAQERIRELIRGDAVRTVQHGEDLFLWPLDVDPSTYAAFRLPGDHTEAQRSAEEIPPEEIRNAALAVLETQVSVPQDDLAREVGRQFGYQRMGPAARDRMLAGIELCVANGSASKSADSIVLAPKP